MSGILPIGIVQIGREPSERYPHPTSPVQETLAMPVTADQIIDALRPVEDPELHRSIVDLGMVKRAEPRPDGTVSVLIALTVAGCPLRNEIQNRVHAAVMPLEGVTGVDLEFTVMTDQEREALRTSLQ